LYKERVVRGAAPMSKERKKSGEEAKKEQRNGLTENRFFVAKAEL
jgi:hypothetical protein